jgi:hypothetical protein
MRSSHVPGFYLRRREYVRSFRQGPSIHMPESLVQVDHARKPHQKKQERGCQEGGWLHCRPQ